jgi:hypothetical protein
MEFRALSSRRIVLAFAAAVALLVSDPTTAQNLLPNPSFDDGIEFTGWSVGDFGTWTLGDDGASCALSSAAVGQSGPAGGGEPYLSLYGFDCMPIDPVALPDLWLGGLYKTSAPVNFRLYARFYSDTGCANPLEYSDAISGLPTGGWNGLQGSVPVPGTAAAFQLWSDVIPQTSGMPPFAASVDQLYAGPEPPLFVNGFEAESGSVCGWNSSQP